MRRTTLSALTGATIALAAGPAAPAEARPSSADPPRAAVAVTEADAIAHRQEELAIALTNAAYRAMERADPRCVIKALPQTTYTHAAPSQALLDTFILLRRPAIPQDALLLPSGAIDGIAAEGVYVDWIRMGRAADGRESYLVPAQRSWRRPALSRACQRLRHRQLVRLTRWVPARVRRIALRAEARSIRGERRAAKAPNGELVYSFSGELAHGGAGGGSAADLATFRKRGLFISMQPTNDDRSVITYWLPDGVASIDVTVPGVVPHNPHLPATVYGADLHLTVPVQDNLASFEIPRPAEDAKPTEVTWHAADGSIIRVVRGW